MSHLKGFWPLPGIAYVLYASIEKLLFIYCNYIDEMAGENLSLWFASLDIHARTFVEIDLEIISTVIFLVKLAQEKVWSDDRLDMTIAVDWYVKPHRPKSYELA